ncbi:MAG: hypothetical protein ABJQ34_14365 [Paracoccaceae bacterium]
MQIKTETKWLFAVVNVCGAAIAASIWTLPTLRPEWIPDLISLCIITLTFTNLTFILSAAIWSGTLSRVTKAGFDGSVSALNYLTRKLRETNWTLPLMFALYLAGAVALSEAKIAPDYTQWRSLDGETLSFFARYTGVLVVSLVVMLGLVWLLRGWYRMTFANLEVVEKHYASSVARAICLVPTATALAQVISALVSFEGLAMLWQPRLGETVYLDVSLAWSDILGASGEAARRPFELILTGADLWAGIFAIALSLGIWLSANFATQLVMNGQKPTIASIAVVVMVASVSIATACYFHYGATATQADLRAGVAETDQTVEAYRTEDMRNLDGLANDADSLIQNYSSQLRREVKEALNTEFQTLIATFESGLAIHADLDAIAAQMYANEKIWRERQDDEVKSGKYTGGVPGFGQVAENLRDIADAYNKSYQSLLGFSALRSEMVATLDVLKIEYSDAIVSFDFEIARGIQDRINRQSQQIYTLSPAGIMGELLAVVSSPLLEGETSRNGNLAEKQAAALAGFEEELAVAQTSVEDYLDAWKEGLAAFGSQSAPERVLPGDMRLDLRQEIDNLEALRDVALQIADTRARAMADVEAQLAEIEAGNAGTSKIGISGLLTSLALIQDGAVLADDIDGARRDLKQLAAFDRAPIKERVSALELSKGNMEERLAEPSQYQPLADFKQLPPLLTLLTYWQIGLIYIALQITLDLFTLGLVWVVSSLHKRKSGNGEFELASSAK